MLEAFVNQSGGEIQKVVRKRSRPVVRKRSRPVVRKRSRPVVNQHVEQPEQADIDAVEPDVSKLPRTEQGK